MRYLVLSLSTFVFFGLGSCKKPEAEQTQRSMSAVITRASDVSSPFAWNAAPQSTYSEIPFARSVRFIGKDYGTNPTNLNIFINNYRGVGVYPIYQGSAKQTDSNSAVLTYTSRDFTSITGNVEIIRDDKELYIGRFSFSAVHLGDTIFIDKGSFTIEK